MLSRRTETRTASSAENKGASSFRGEKVWKERTRSRRRNRGIKKIKKTGWFERIACPHPAGDISFSVFRTRNEERREGLHCLFHLSLSDSLISLPWLTRRERTITFFLFSFNYRCQGVVPTTTSTSSSRISLSCSFQFPLLFLYLFQLSARREFVIALDFVFLTHSETLYSLRYRSLSLRRDRKGPYFFNVGEKMRLGQNYQKTV